MSSHLRKDGSPDQAEPTLKDLVDTYVNRLQRAGVYSPEGDVRKIVAFVFGEPSPSLTRHVSADLRNKMDWLIQQREARRPLARIFGFAEFYGLPIKTHDGVFQPYPETEILVDVATDYFRDRRAPLRILDVGSGSGCVLLALLNEYPRATGVGVDRDMPAVAAGKENARHLGFADQASFVIGDWTEGVREQFDLIVCNPPRVPTPMVSRLLPEMRDFDPRAAYDGGLDGLACFRLLAEDFGTLAKPGGVGIFQVSDAPAVADIMRSHGLVDVHMHSNYLGIPAAVSVIKRR
jgi:release factor glutamine methyltransferase